MGNVRGLSFDSKLALMESMQDVGAIEDVVREAYQTKGGRLWQQVQRSLFALNIRMMEEGFSLGSQRAEIEFKIRNLIESVEREDWVDIEMPTEISDPAEFVAWLKERVAEHRVNHHLLFEYFDRDELKSEEVRYFLSNYRVNMQRFHLHVAAYSLFVPFGMREELYENLHDEFGEGDFEQAHPNLFEPLMDHFGGVKPDDWNPETFNLLNTKINLCWFADGLHYGMGGMGALELSIPAQQKVILAHLRRRGLSEDLVKFFVVHCELDESHGDGWFAAGLPYVNTRADMRKVYIGAMRMLEARAGVYDGILAGIELRRGIDVPVSSVAAVGAN